MYSVYVDGVLLPIAPPKIQSKISNRNQTITLINDQEINILKKAGLTEIAFTLMIPQANYPFARYEGGFKSADYFLNHFESLKTEMKKFPFVISRVSPSGKLLFDTNLKMALEDYSIVDDAGEGLDIVVSIKLKQSPDFGTKEVVVKSNATTGKAIITSTQKKRESSKVIPKTYKVKSGDTLWAICKKELGDGSKYGAIAKLNGISNPSRISVGTVIKLG